MLKGHYAVLNNWVKDLKLIAQNPGNQNMSFLAGRAAMIECHDVHAYQEVIPKIAQIANMQYLSLTPDEVLSWISGEQGGQDLIRGNTPGAPTLA